MLCNYSFMLLIAIFVTRTESQRILQIFENGGYTVKLCLALPIEQSRDSQITCKNSSEVCKNGTINLCALGCQFKTKNLKYNKHLHNIQFVDRPLIQLMNTKRIYESGDDLTFTVKSLLNLTMFLTNEIEISFSNNISCSLKVVTDKLINCKLNAKSLNKDKNKKISITFRFGLGCAPSQFIAYIQVQNHLRSKFYWILIIIFPIIIIIVSIYYIVSKIKTTKRNNNILQKELLDQQIKYTKAQKKAFLEYQIAVTSFPNLGKFSPRHIHSFQEYMIRALNVEFKAKLKESYTGEIESFKNMLLNKNQLFIWIKQVEMGCRIQDRFLVSAFLTIFLFQYPEYFLEVMKDLLIQLAMELKIKSPQYVMFEKQEYIIEMIVSNWLKLFMYDNLKEKFIGERLFNLYRSIKCKINTGLVDHYTKKAKYTICSDHLLTVDHDYETLKIKARIKVKVNLMDILENSAYIDLENIEVEVLSLDTISQAIAKILDRAIMKYIELKTSNDPDQQGSLAFSVINYDNYLLYFKVNNVQMLLSNFDYTSIASTIENRECVIINTMKHYNIKSGTELLLTSRHFSSPDLKLSSKLENLFKVHLLFPKQCEDNNPEIQRMLSTESQSKLIFEPLKDSDDKVSHYMILLGTKKSLYPFINAFLQCIIDWNPKENLSPSRDSLFSPNEDSQILGSPSFSLSTDVFQPNFAYVTPVYYLFNIFDEIWSSFNMEDTINPNLWKGYCFMHQFWMQIVQNPDFIFDVDKSIEVTNSLKTISDILKDTCLRALGKATDQDSPAFINKLFHEEIKNYYSHWWQSFIDRRHTINKADVVYGMSSIVKQYEMNIYNPCALNNLHIISRTLLLERLGT